MTDKALGRRELLQRRRTLPAGEARRASEAVGRTLARLAAACGWRTLGCYLAFDGEISADGFIADCLARGVTVAVPVVGHPGRPLAMVPLEALGRVVSGPHGVRQPAPPLRDSVAPEALDAVVIPGVGFDSRGTRLGYGLGYYDRTLAAVAGKVPVIALAHDWQVIESLPREKHDLPVDGIITDLRFIVPPAGPLAGTLPTLTHQEDRP